MHHNFSYSFEVLVTFFTLDTCFTCSFVIYNGVKYIYYDYHNTFFIGYIGCDFGGYSLIIFSHTGQELI